MNDVTAAYYSVLINGEYGEDTEQSSVFSQLFTISRSFKDTSDYSSIPLVPNHICCGLKFRIFSLIHEYAFSG